MATYTAESDYVCGWSTTDDCCSELTDASPELRDQALTAAAELLYQLSGRQFGECDYVVRPCRLECCDPCNGGDSYGGRGGSVAWTPVLQGGQWTNVACGSCGDACSCSTVSEVALPGPISSVTEVKVDGRILEPQEYRVDDHRTLVRVKHPGPVPTVTGLHTNFTSTTGDEVSWCFSVEPDTVIGAQPDGGCFTTAGVGPPSFRWTTATPGWTATYRANGPGATTAFVIGAPDGSDQYSWPTGSTLTPGQSLDSARRASDDTWMRLTFVSGTGTIERVGNPWQFGPGEEGTIRAEVLGIVAGGEWPTCQEMTRETDQVDTWEVSYLRGQPVPEGGRLALSTLACELVKACTDDPSCKLPQRVTSISRQGVSMALLDPMDYVRDGRTGLYIVDVWLNAVNPKKRVRRSGIYSPDMVDPRETTWRAP